MIVKDILTEDQIKKYGLDSKAASADETEIKKEPVLPAQNPLLDELMQDEDMEK